MSDTVVIQLGTFAAGAIWTERHQVQVPANSSQVVWQGEAPHIIARPDHYLLVRSPFGRFPPNRHFFAAIKDLLRPAVEPEISISANGEHELSVQVFAPRYLYYFHVIVPHEHTHFSDNYFDLAAGEGRTVVMTNPKIHLTPDMVSYRLALSRRAARPASTASFAVAGGPGTAAKRGIYPPASC